MTRIRIFTDSNRSITGFEMSGHTGYSDHGSDIVCAAVSAISQTAVIGITEVLGISADVSVDDQRGLLRLALRDDKNEGCQIILRTMVAGLQSIIEQYPDYIRLTFL